MKKDYLPTLIVMQPGRVREGLEALVTTVPSIDIIGRAEQRSSALEMVARSRPQLVVLDWDLPGVDVVGLLGDIKKAGAGTACIILADRPGDQLQMRAAGADVVLAKWYRASKLLAVIKRLTQQNA